MRQASFGLPDRDVLAARRRRDLVRGRGTKADVWLSALDDGTPVVVKEFRRDGRSRWLRPLLLLWGRCQTRREMRFLQLLADLPQVPELLGPLGKDGFAMSYVPGRQLLDCRAPEEREKVISQLRQFLSRLHERGVVHLDLRNRENAHLGPDGRVVFIDWASAFQLPPGSLRHRLFFRPLASIDVSALIKWKQLLAPASVSAADREFLRRFRFWRRLWPVNRKGLGRIDEG